MRLTALVLLFTVFCAHASAQECDRSGFVRAQDSYILRSVGIVASDEPVVQGGATLSCGPWAYDLFASWGAAGGTANELDFSVFYTEELGPVRVQLAGSYYALNLRDSLFDPADDMVELYADVSLPLTWGRLTVAPLLRVGALVGVDELDSLALVQPGVRGSLQITDRFSVSGEYRGSYVVQDYVTHQFSSALAWQASRRTQLRLGYEDTNRTRDTFSFGAFTQF